MQHQKQLVQGLRSYCSQGVEELDYHQVEQNLLHVLKIAKLYQEGFICETESKLGILLVASLLFLTACGTSQVTADSHGFWEKLVYFFAEPFVFILWWQQGDWDYSLYLDYPDSSPAGLPISDDFLAQATGSTTAYQAAAGKVSW